MKLNLLPTYVSRDKQIKSSIIVSALIALLSIGAAVFMIISSRGALEEERQRAAAALPRAQAAVAKALEADAIIAQAAWVIRNINLADAMNQHNTVYPDLYAEIYRYIPSFFRITNISAQPAGEQTVVTMTGVIRTYQQYADLMLALLRIPGAISVSRSGYQNIDPIVPALNPTDQQGRPRRPGEDPIPDDPLERLEYFIARGQSTGFTGTGGFGTTDTGARGAMPDWSQITVAIVLQRNIQPPNPRATLAAGGSGTPAPGGPQPGAPGNQFPGAPPAPPGPTGGDSVAPEMTGG